jgi:hypothetical protein
LGFHFPELPFEELSQLARDIKEQGQLEPIILNQGLIWTVGIAIVRAQWPP